MDKVQEILSSKYRIVGLTFNNFTTSSLDEEISIDINIRSEVYGNKKIHFSPVREVKVDDKVYKATDYSSIIITDISELQWSEVRYKVCISDNLMSFYCKTVDLE